MAKSEFVLGHEAVGHKLNVRRELSRIRRDPLEAFLLVLGEDPHGIFSSDVSRYHDAYLNYFLAMRRFFENMSITYRYNSSVRDKRGYRSKYTSHEQRISDKYRALRPYLEFDIVNCLLHTRILLDRVAGLSRRFLRLRQTPSFTSFSDHKKFFERQASPLTRHEDYADYLRNHTGWFEVPVKEVRDKFVVHAAPKHMRFVVRPNNYEVELMIFLPDEKESLARTTAIRVNPLRMSYDIEIFLNWFSAYGSAAASMA